MAAFHSIADLRGVLHKQPMVWPFGWRVRLCTVWCAAILLLATPALNARTMSPAHHWHKNDPRDVGRCKLRAVHPADNDIRADQDRRLKSDRPVDLPAPVAREILRHVSQAVKNSFSVREWIEAKQSCSDTFSPVFELTGPAGLQLYVASRYFPIGNAVDYFLVYDPRTAAVTSSPPFTFTKWWGTSETDNPLMKRPYVRMDAARDGLPPLLIVEEQTHNGNVYNAAVYHYFEIAKDMSLSQVLAVEARAILFSETTERKATFLTPDSVRIDVSTSLPAKWEAKGTVLLQRGHTGEPFRVARRMPARGTSRRGLITYCDSAKNDDDFLRVGCDFYY